MYQCLYNLELLILATGRPPFQDYHEPIRKETPANYVRQLTNTDVDALMICPTAWKRPLWDSKVDAHWKEEAPFIRQPYFSADLKFHEKAYFRLKDYMLAGNDPVGVTVTTAKESGIAPFISYRMNDHHYLNQADAFVHPKFWKDNPQFWIGEENRHFDYMHEEVRAYYYSLLAELVEKYDIAGLELDFMRSPVYFKEEELEQGREVMTDFVLSIRHLLDAWGTKREKELKLCVRVPHTTKWCYEAGLDVERWDRERIIDMVNVSTYFISSPKLDVEGYKKIVKHAPLYGEMHFIIDKVKLLNGFMNNCTRKTTKEMYQSLAAVYLDKGMDGISFFNTDYARHHFFEEPRRYHLKDGQPPLSSFKGITDPEYLKKVDKHYFVGPYYSELPMVNDLNMQIYVADQNIPEKFKHAILRIRTQEPCERIGISAQLNGHPLEEMLWLGELFPPLSIEGVARPEYVKYYRVPVEILRHGDNQVIAKNLCEDPTLWDKRVVYEMVELAIYHNNSFMEA